MILLLICLALFFSGCGKKADSDRQSTAAVTETVQISSQEDARENDETRDKGENRGDVKEGGSYDSKEDVAAYIVAFGKLPDNYITKKEARALGWDGGSVERYAPGKCIGGDRFGNYEGNLPEDRYTECDIDTLGRDDRGARRLVFSDEEIYYTHDHYETFEKVCDR